jgi:hypothetical protein
LSHYFENLAAKRENSLPDRPKYIETYVETRISACRCHGSPATPHLPWQLRNLAQPCAILTPPRKKNSATSALRGQRGSMQPGQLPFLAFCKNLGPKHTVWRMEIRVIETGVYMK